jgi:hypothetical protein
VGFFVAVPYPNQLSKKLFSSQDMVWVNCWNKYVDKQQKHATLVSVESMGIESQNVIT